MVITFRTIHYMIQVTAHFRAHTLLYLMTLYIMTDCDLDFEFMVKKRFFFLGTCQPQFTRGSDKVEICAMRDLNESLKLYLMKMVYTMATHVRDATPNTCTLVGYQLGSLNGHCHGFFERCRSGGDEIVLF